MRAFLGVSLPEKIRSLLEQLQRALAESEADVKWVEPSNLHVTLAFLDEISEAQRQAVEALLARVAEREESFLLGLGAVGAFPSVESPRVVWVGLTEGKERVVHLAERIGQEGAAIRLRREERPLSPHLTLGRVRSPRGRVALTHRLRTTPWQPPPPWNVSTLTLYHSILHPAGPHYAVLADIPLTGGDFGGANRGRSGQPEL